MFVVNLGCVDELSLEVFCGQYGPSYCRATSLCVSGELIFMWCMEGSPAGTPV